MKISSIFLLIPLCIMQIASEEASKKSVASTLSLRQPPPYYKPSPGIIYYHYQKDISSSKLKRIFRQINRFTCLNFHEKKDSPVEGEIGINFEVNERENKVSLSRDLKSPTIVSLKKDVYDNNANLSFYIGLALDIIPEVKRHDREVDVTVQMNNVQEGFEQYYNVAQLDEISYLVDTEFDFKSPMFFGSKFGSKDNKPTYDVKLYKDYEYFSNGVKILRHNDYKHIFNHYCPMTRENDCKNGGYYPPTDEFKSKCKCPEHFDGLKCQYLKKNEGGCISQEQEVTAKETKDELRLKVGKGVCYFRISSKNDKNVSITIEQLVLKNGDCETFKSNVEVLVRNDKGAAGINLCKDKSESISLPKLSKEVILVLKSYDDDTFIKFSYQAAPEEVSMSA
uniref:Astacin domain-containing protein n=1 Tax=Strongyloides papillosus TaxID=174720 RepID=A0A0N5CI88_STREA